MEDWNWSELWTQPWKWGEDLIVTPNRKWVPDKDTAWAKHKCGAKKKNCLTAARVKNSNAYRGQAGKYRREEGPETSSRSPGISTLDTQYQCSWVLGWVGILEPILSTPHPLRPKVGFCLTAAEESHYQGNGDLVSPDLPVFPEKPDIGIFMQKLQFLDVVGNKSIKT